MAALKNKLGIIDSTELAREEERISKRRAAGLFESGLLDALKPGSYSALQTIHKYLFSDIYEFEGNGRSTRIWLDQILKKELGKVIDWSLVDKDDYLMAMERSPVKDVEIKVLLKAALTDQVNSREMFMKGVDHSYDYEGYSSYRTQDLVKQTYTQRKKQEMQEERE